MIPWHLILLAAGITGLVVVAVAKLMSWSVPASVGAALAAAGGMIVWRAGANAWDLNEDIFSLVSPGDLGCLVAGALGPGVVAKFRREGSRGLAVASIAGAVAFVVNVVVL